MVDDDPDYRLMVRLALEGDGTFTVVGEAADGQVAAVEATALSPPPDLVLFECSGAGAFAGLGALRRAVPEARLVLVSGHQAEDVRLASQAAGALGYLAKTTPARQLAVDLQALVGLVDVVQQVLDEARTRLGKDAGSPRAARHFVREALEMWQLDDLADAVMLLVTELVTNSIVHADSEVEVAVRLTPDAARVEVTDASATPPTPRQATGSDTSGRGMELVESMARRWGVRPGPAGGKTVWFEVDR